jgi:hypothetical protein
MMVSRTLSVLVSVVLLAAGGSADTVFGESATLGWQDNATLVFENEIPMNISFSSSDQGDDLRLGKLNISVVSQAETIIRTENLSLNANQSEGEEVFVAELRSNSSSAVSYTLAGLPPTKAGLAYGVFVDGEQIETVSGRKVDFELDSHPSDLSIKVVQHMPLSQYLLAAAVVTFSILSAVAVYIHKQRRDLAEELSELSDDTKRLVAQKNDLNAKRQKGDISEQEYTQRVQELNARQNDILRRIEQIKSEHALSR